MRKLTNFAYVFILIHIITTISVEETRKTPSTPNFLPLEHSSRHKIKTGENLYFSKQMKTGKSYKVQVNSPNVMLYAAEKSKCQVPSQKCRQRTGNIHHSFIYEPQKDGELRIDVQGLDNTEFELTIIDSDNKVSLTDAVPFSYNMDTAQQRIEFTFTLKEKSDVSFNLIAPLGAVTLIVSYPSPNGENEVQKSSDGYIQIAKQSLTKLNFTVKVQKTRTTENYASHFTLVASSSKSHLRLDPTVTHYETLSQDKSREYILQFSFKQQHVLSFSFYNLNKEIDLELLYCLNEQWDKSKSLKIDKEVQFIELNDKAKQLCEQQSESCEIFIKVVNHMSVQVDFTLTLLVKDAILELKDGIWQSFPANEVMTSSSFYFYPKHSQNNLLLFYHSTLSNLRVVYKLWKYDRENINPAKWPFPFVVEPSQKTQAEFKKSNFISIDKEQIQKICWPNCVLLVNFYIETDATLPYNYYQSSQFKIMASNSQIELPEKHKTTFTLGKQEDKQILIDLKYPLTKEAITFYTAQTIGQCTLSANVYSQKNQKCPIIDESPDFALSWGEYSIQIEALNKVLKSKEMQDDKNLYLCIVVHSEDSCKLSIEYTAQDDIFKEIYVDAFEDIKLGSNQTKYFQMDGAVEHYSKITRIKGFPFVYLKNCKDKGELEECKEEFAKSQEKGKQIIAKT